MYKHLATFTYIILIALILLASISSTAYIYSLDETRHVIIVAVSQLQNSSYIGVSADLYVRVTCPGSGHVYVETLPLSQIDLQASTRIAAIVASSIANVSFHSCDFYASIKSDSPIIGGPSASGVTAVAFAAALLRLPLNESIVMTGMIMPDGSIGPVGGLKYKLDAAASRGAKIFLVPYGQTKDVVYRIVTQRIGPTVINRVVTETIDLISYGAKLNITVVPVANVFEALNIFTNRAYSVSSVGIKLLENLKDVYGILNAVQYEWVSNLSREIYRVVNESKYIEDKALSSLSGYSMLYVKDLLRSIDSNIDNLKNQAESLASMGKLYAASSIYFQVLIYAYQRLHLLKSIIDRTYISQEINTINSSTYEVIEYVNRYYKENSIDMSRLSIAINTLDRAYEALIYLNKTLSTQYIDSASQYLALASARMYTAKLWSTLLNRSLYTRSLEIPVEDLDAMSLYIITLAQNIYTYIIAFSSSLQIPQNVLSDATDRYILLSRVDRALDRIALGISSISYMHLALVSIFLQDYNSTIEALNKTIDVSLTLLNMDTLPIDVPLYIEMIKAFESNPQIQITMMSRLSMILSIYRTLSIEKPPLTYTKPVEEKEITKTVKETVTITTTITVTTTVIQQPQERTITITTTRISSESQLRIEDILLLIMIILIIAVIWLIIRKI
jgi:uncharacterized protein